MRKRWKEPPDKRPVELVPNFQHRYVRLQNAPLKAGTYKVISDWYHVPRRPSVGESCTAYIELARQAGTLVKTTVATLVVETP